MFITKKVMNNENFNFVRQSITNRTLTDDDVLLEQLRITKDKDLPPIDFLYRIFGQPCFPRGEIVVISGKAKSGKTLFNSMLMACCVRDEVLQIQRPFDEVDDTWQCLPIRCLWYDTEQSEQSTQEILKDRILRLATNPDISCKPQNYTNYYDIFNVRTLHYDDRLRLFEKAVHKHHPDLVVLDGVRDLLSDINDGIKAQEIVEHLMKLAQSTNCCLVCVLHQNKGAEDHNPRGWLGTELLNKAFEVYSCEKAKPENIFIVEQTHTRKYDWPKLMCFRMDAKTELPVISEPPTRYAAMQAEQTGQKLPYMTREYLTFDNNGKPHPKTRELFYEALKTGPMFYTELQKKVQSTLRCGNEMWNSMFKEMRDTGYIVNTKNQEGKSIWQLPTAADSGDSPSS